MTTRPKKPKSAKPTVSSVKYGTWQTTVVFHAGDKELLDFLETNLGTSRAEVIRTSVRVYAAIVQGITARREGV